MLKVHLLTESVRGLYHKNTVILPKSRVIIRPAVVLCPCLTLAVALPTGVANERLLSRREALCEAQHRASPVELRNVLLSRPSTHALRRCCSLQDFNQLAERHLSQGVGFAEHTFRGTEDAQH